MFPLHDTVAIFALVATLILVMPFAMKRIKVPPLVGMLLVGAILGPNALHILDRDQSFILLGDVGLMFIMLIAALEIDLQAFKKFGVHSFVFFIFTFGIPLTISTPIALYVLDYPLIPGILLASIFSSHTLVTYPAASRLGISKSRSVTTAIGGTMMADTAALLLLGVLVGLGTQGDIDEAYWWRLAVSLSIYVGAVLLGLPRLGRWAFRKAKDDTTVQFAFVVAAIFICAALSHAGSLEPIVGAFLAGLALNRLIPHNGALMNRISFVSDSIFIPFFLLSVGMLLDVRVLFTGTATWVIIAYLVTLVLITKFLAAEATRLFLRFSKAESRVVYSLTVAQAAATLAVVGICFDVGLFDETVVNAAIVMIAVTCTIAPLVMARYGPEVARREADLADRNTDGPPQRVLVALPDLTAAQPVIELALLLRDHAQHQPIYLVHAASDDCDVGKVVPQAERMLHDAVTLCSAADVAAEFSTSIGHTIGGALRLATKEVHASHLVLHWSFEAPDSDSVLGSIIDELVRTNPRTLVFLRNRHPLTTTRRVIVAVPPLAFDVESLASAAAAIKRLAQQLAAPIEVLADDDTWARCQGELVAARPETAIDHRHLASWTALAQALHERATASDIVAIIGHREAEPEVARVPIDLAKRFRTTTLILVYGSSTQAASGALEKSPPALALVNGGPSEDAGETAEG